MDEFVCRAFLPFTLSFTSTAFTLAAGTVEVSGRALGLTHYGVHVVKAAGKRAANLSRYTRALFGTYSAASIQEDHQMVASLPHNGWDLADRLALFTLPGAIAATEIIGAAGLTALAGSGETLGRVAGLTTFGSHVIRASAKRSANISSRYTRWLFGTYDQASIKLNQDILASRPQTAWEGVDRLSFVTLPGALALAQVSVASAFTLAAGTVEVSGRALGLTDYGVHVVKAAGKRAANLSRYTRALFGTYSAASIQEDHQMVASLPRNGWELANRAALFTLPGAIAATELLGAAGLTVLAGSGEALARTAGLTSFGSHVIKAAAKRSANISSRYTGWLFGTYDQASIKLDQDVLTSKPQTAWDGIDRLSFVTLPGAFALAQVSIASAFTLGLGSIESVGRVLGISNRSKNLLALAAATCGNMFGVAAPANRPEKIQGLKAPVRSWWDVCDCLGLAISTAVSTVCTGAIAPLAFLGFSKSNYHRFCFYKHRIGNLLDERRKKPVNKALEEYHAQELTRCEQSSVGYFFSKLNVFNVTAQTTFAIARLIVAPTIYAIARIVKGIIPATIRAIGRAFYPKDLENLDDPIVRVRKRFADLNKALNLSGKLPRQPEGQAAVLQIQNAVEEANKRDKSFFKRAGFTLFSEARRIISLGHTPEEKILAEFEDKFEQFVNAKRRAERRGEPAIPVSQFFKNDVMLPNRERFSYDFMVKHVKGSFTSEQDQQAIERIAGLLRNDLEREMEPGAARALP